MVLLEVPVLTLVAVAHMLEQGELDNDTVKDGVADTLALALLL